MVRPANLLTAVVAAALVATLLVGGSLAATPKEQLKAKQAEAQQILAQVNTLDDRMDQTVEAWNGARYELGKTRTALASERTLLRTAERQRARAVARVRARVIALYESSDQPTTLSVFLGSSTIGEMIDRINAARAVADADHQLAVETTQARDRYAVAASRLQATERRREADVAQLDSQRRNIESLLAQRKELLSHVQSQVTALRAEEARRQARLEAEARARLAAEAVARQQAAQAAAAAAAKAKQPVVKSPPPTAPPVSQPATTTTTTTTSSSPPPTPPAPSTTTTTAAPPTFDPPPTTSFGPGHPQAASIAMRYLGVPYLWGGATPSGFDCSGLVMYVYAQLGVALPHFAAAQYGLGTPVPRDQLQPGDLVFFNGLDHVGIYIGGGQMVHAPHTGDVVKIAPLSDGGGYVGARRI
jgi:cell wall-associated NlpC family hydrolase